MTYVKGSIKVGKNPWIISKGDLLWVVENIRIVYNTVGIQYGQVLSCKWFECKVFFKREVVVAT